MKTNKNLMLVISATNHYKQRAQEVIKQYNNNYDVTYVTSDFDHITKSPFVCNVPNSVQLHVIKYYKNISVSRILSHCMFSFKTFFYMLKVKPSKVYVEIPNNTLVMSAALYKKISKCEVIMDIFDMWPESFPNKSSNPMFKLAMGGWRFTRNGFLKSADRVWIECDYYRELLNSQGVDIPMQTRYLKNDAAPMNIETNFSDESLDLCYVGSINNIVDRNLIVTLLSKLAKKRKTVLHLVGTGETLELLAEELRENGVDVICYGIVYDQKVLQSIFNKCAFAINMIKEDLAIGVTMKSITYLLGGVGLINSVQGDTKRFVDEYGIGINIDRENISKTVEQILNCTEQDLIDIKQNAVLVYKKYFMNSTSGEK